MLELFDGALVPDSRPVSVGGVRPGLRPLQYVGPERRSGVATARRLAQVLDLIDYGVLLMQDAERVAAVNKAAQQVLAEGHPLLLDQSRLATRHARDELSLQEAVQGARERGLRRMVRLGARQAPGGMAAVAVLPLAPLGHELQHGVVLLLSRRRVCETLTVDAYARAHALTPAESQVLRGLCEELTPLQIAERQGVGLATVRTQIGCIRSKTGASSIRALVQQVALLPPLVPALPLPTAGFTTLLPELARAHGGQLLS
ncbi:MAG: hypothetical protein RLY78_2162 [Pseudomonadota bacterium]|jgi:DNA-binding CsgD family transcriptional regulator|uniref:Helix-turn-helix transcriptional regulator n=1 Tax=Pseudaquabacterium rugosum TaxID=2984194 RepID=A0ABU9BFG5_9BURK